MPLLKESWQESREKDGDMGNGMEHSSAAWIRPQMFRLHGQCLKPIGHQSASRVGFLVTFYFTGAIQQFPDYFLEKNWYDNCKFI